MESWKSLFLHASIPRSFSYMNVPVSLSDQFKENSAHR
jgi:hypothetical protein